MRATGVIAGLAVVAVGCGGSSSDATSNDATIDATIDAAIDAGFEASLDAGGDRAPPPCIGTCLYASPTGSGTTCSFDAPCALSSARDAERAKAAAGDVHVYLFGGTYALTAPFSLDARDSGKTGHPNVWSALPGDVAIVSGGVAVKGPWTPIEPSKKVWRAAIDPSVRSRQLYVNDRRAVRARGLPTTFTKTSTGYTTGDATLAGYAHPDELEVFGVATWNAYRCPVASVSGTTVTMEQPCWSGTQWHAPWTLDAPSWIENAPELIDEEGEFYLDETAHVLDYAPRTGEPIASPEVIVPVAESLFSIAGTLDAPAHDLVVSDVTFAHATWMQPSTKLGYADLQAGVYAVDDAPISGFPTKLQKMPAAFEIANASAILVDSCVFEHLGAAALNVEVGAHDVTILGSRFEDVSGTGIAVGDVTHTDDANPTDPREVVSGVVVRDDLVTNVGVDYPDVAAIFFGYVKGSTIEHCDLFDVPYSGISLGWGWTTDASILQDNRVLATRVSHAMRVLVDGGGVYTLSRDGGSLVTGNHIDNQRAEPTGGLYFDNGSAGFDAASNVVEHVSYWLLLQTYSTHAIDNQVHDNFSDTDAIANGPPDPSNVLSGNTVISGGSWPKPALDIMSAAGLEPAYRSMHPNDLARGKTTSASSIWSGGGAFPPSAANDGDAFTGWSPEGTDKDPLPWWQVDLGAPSTIARVEVVTRWDYPDDSTRRNFEIEASDDPSFATHVVLGAVGNETLPLHAIFTVRSSDATKYRYVRLAKTAKEYFFLADVHVLGAP